MSVLLIGGGLVGSQIANILVGQGEDLTILDYSPQPDSLADNVDSSKLRVMQGDILNPLDITRALRESNANQIIHTAAYPMLTIGAQENPYGAVQINIMGTVNVLEAARIHGVERVVAVSSGVLAMFWAGGEDNGESGKEEAYPRPTSFYATTKQAVESLAHNYADFCGVDVRLVRYAAIAGPWRGRGGGGPSNVFRDMVETAIRTGETSVAPQSVEWVYSKDAAKGTVLALQANNPKGRVFNVGTGTVTTPEDMADAVKAALPATKVSVSGQKPTGGFAAVPLSMSRSKTEIGYEPSFDMAGAIRDYAEWYKNRKP
ncbi:MAG: threonine 3-dehydrogenase [Chloroflexi bacterium]|jgi:nucleoside-diphosphate-sugar epimerase|nr:MAG: threonine 3-dehydrogenase [Chloroflexota bacterium]